MEKILATISQKLRRVGALGLVLLGCDVFETEMSLDELARSLQGMRLIQARVTGLHFVPCSSSEDLIPVARCETADLERRLRPALRRLARAEQDVVTATDLHISGLARLLIGRDHPATLSSAAVDLQEAVRLETDPARRSRMLSDLSAAHLQLAEVHQSPLEVAVSLEAALQALELDPANGAAAFNRDLAFLLLGIRPLDRSETSDPWRAELRSRRLEIVGDGLEETRSRCFSEDQLRQALDAWSMEARQKAPSWLESQQRCLADSRDRFFADLLADIDSSPEPIARAWLGFADLRKAYRGFDLDAVAAELRRLLASDSVPVRLAALSFEASIAYQRTEYDASRSILDRLLQESSERSYLQLVARCHRLNALIAQVRGDYGEGWSHLEQALAAAHASRSDAMVAAILALRVEFSERSGREDAAWLEAAHALRGLGVSFSSQRVNCLHGAARLAQARELDRVTESIHRQAVDEASRISSVFEVAALKTRGEYLARRGRLVDARHDLEQGLGVLESSDIPPAVQGILAADLLLLRGLAGKTFGEREAALLEVVERFRASQYDQRIITAEVALAGLRLEREDRAGAKAGFLTSFTELEVQVGSFDSWADASALVAAGRGLTGELLALQLDDGDVGEALDTLGAYLGLRSGASSQTAGATPQRLSYFVRDDELLIFLERGREVVFERVGVSRRQLTEDRDLLLLQLHRRVAESRLEATTRSLARVLLQPIAGRLAPDAPLIVVADDVLAGLPFNLLPIDGDGTLLIDRHAVSYASDLCAPPELPRPRRLLTVAVASSTAGLPALPRAEDEARAVAELYPSARQITGGDATAPAVVGLLGDWDAAHLVSHFVVNPRLPLESYLALSGQGRDSRLTLEQLSRASKGSLALLYLSACDTGRGLPPAAHGIHSLAQAFAAMRIGTTVLSFWPLADRIGFELAIAFHRQLAAGASPAEALARAQRAHRGEHPGEWAALAVYHGGSG